MKYMLLMYANEANVPQTPEEQQTTAPVWQVWQAVAQEMEAAGVLVSNSGLSSIANATTVRVRDHKTLITDGPFAETHEQLGGYFLVECKDLDEAIRWAEEIPAAKYGSVEVRPQWTPEV